MTNNLKQSNKNINFNNQIDILESPTGLLIFQLNFLVTKNICLLLRLIEINRTDPKPLVSHTMKIDDAPTAYKLFDKKNNVTKVVFKTGYKNRRVQSKFDRSQVN